VWYSSGGRRRNEKNGDWDEEKKKEKKKKEREDYQIPEKSVEVAFLKKSNAKERRGNVTKTFRIIVSRESEGWGGRRGELLKGKEEEVQTNGSLIITKVKPRERLAVYL